MGFIKEILAEIRQPYQDALDELASAVIDLQQEPTSCTVTEAYFRLRHSFSQLHMLALAAPGIPQRMINKHHRLSEKYIRTIQKMPQGTYHPTQKNVTLMWHGLVEDLRVGGRKYFFDRVEMTYNPRSRTRTA